MKEAECKNVEAECKNSVSFWQNAYVEVFECVYQGLPYDCGLWYVHVVTLRGKWTSGVLVFGLVSQPSGVLV